MLPKDSKAAASQAAETLAIARRGEIPCRPTPVPQKSIGQNKYKCAVPKKGNPHSVHGRKWRKTEVHLLRLEGMVSITK